MVSPYGLLFCNDCWRYDILNNDQLMMLESEYRKKFGLVRLNLGCGSDVREGWINCDMYPVDECVEHVDLTVFPFGFPDDYADVILFSNILEHVPRPYETVKELHRVLKPGGRLIIEIPVWCDTIQHLRMYHTVNYLRGLFIDSGRSTGYDKQLFRCLEFRCIKFRGLKNMLWLMRARFVSWVLSFVFREFHGEFEKL